jgi:putative ABC transport system permease protein
MTALVDQRTLQVPQPATALPAGPGIALAWTLARRELRGGLKGLRLLIACLVLGVAAIAGVGSLSRSILEGLAAQGRVLLGGDIEVRLTHREATLPESRFFATVGTVSDTARMRAMVRSQASDERLLGELKAVDVRYPMYGAFELMDGGALQERLRFAPDGIPGVVIDPILSDRIEAPVGSLIQIGDGTFRVAGLIKVEPDRANEGFALGPSVIIGMPALARTNLVQPGSLVRWHYRIKTAPDVNVETAVEQMKTAFPNADWRITDRRNGAPGVRRFIDQLGQFLTLVGLTALMVSGVGVANAVSAHLARKVPTIATLKTMGAPSRLVFETYLIQIALVGVAAILLGLALGAALPPFLAQLLSAQLPVPPKIALYWQPLLLAGSFGALVALAAALWPLAQAKDTPAARLFRARIAGLDRRPGWPVIAGIAVTLSAVIALAVLTSTRELLALGVVGAAFAILALLRAIAWGVTRVAARLPRPKAPLARLALGNLHRPGAVTPAVLTALGLGLTMFATLAVVETNLNAQLRQAMPGKAPAFFFLDIPPDDAQRFQQVASGVAGVGAIEMVPSLRGAVTSLNGVSTATMTPPKEDGWFIRGDRQLTYMADLPEGNVITAGQWWPADYAGPPLVSLDSEIGLNYGLKVGDTIGVSVLGVELVATIANFRRVDWESLGFNFAMLFAPGTLESAPHTFMATVEASPAAEPVLFRTLTDAFPTASAIRFKEVATSVTALFEQMATAIRATALVTIIAGILVLIGAMAAGQAAKTYDAVLLKVLGAQRRQILAAYLMEYALLGAIAGVIAVLCGLGAGWVVVTQIFDMSFSLDVGPLLATVAGGAVLTIALGLVGTWAALRVRPNAVLRSG